MCVHFLGKKSPVDPRHLPVIRGIGPLTRTIVRIDPTKPLVLWDNIVLKGVTAGHGALPV